MDRRVFLGGLTLGTYRCRTRPRRIERRSRRWSSPACGRDPVSAIAAHRRARDQESASRYLFAPAAGRGCSPANLPVEQPRKFELVINLNAAKSIGLTIPQSVLVRADDILQ